MSTACCARRALLTSRARAAKGELSRAELRAAKDAAIRDVLAFRERLDPQSVTDGEFRRTFQIDFLERIEGIAVPEGGIAAHFHRKVAISNFAPPRLATTDKLRRPG